MENSYKLRELARRELYSFTRGMFYLLRGKISLTEALFIISENYKGEMKERVLKVKRKIESGSPLKDAFKNITADKEFLELIRIGEETGNLEMIFKSLWGKYEFRQKLTKDIKNLSLYPMVVITTAFIIVLILLKTVVPKFILIYSDIGQELPPLTRFVMKLSTLLDRYGIVVGISLVIVIFLFIRVKERNREVIERILLNMPLFGKMYKELCVLNFTQNMSSLIESGVPLLRALRLCTDSNSLLLNREIKKIAEKIEKGESIQKSIGRSVFFNREYKSFLVIGEKIGRLSDSFENLSSLYYEKISQRTKTLLKLLEPLSILFIGFIIGIIIFAVMLPIFKMGEFL